MLLNKGKRIHSYIKLEVQQIPALVLIKFIECAEPSFKHALQLFVILWLIQAVCKFLFLLSIYEL